MFGVLKKGFEMPVHGIKYLFSGLILHGVNLGGRWGIFHFLIYLLGK
jgi:hypothetical protein